MNSPSQPFETAVVEGDKTMDQLVSAVPTSGHQNRWQGALAGAGRFLWHFVQMILAMEAGMMVFHLLVAPLLARTGYGALTKAYPLVGYWMMVVSMALPMIALMRYHRSTWPHCLEMTIAMLAPLAALTALVLCHVLPAHTLYRVGDPLMFLAMAVYMLCRPHQHAHGPSRHTGHQHASSSEAETTQQSANETHQSCEHAGHAA